MQDEDEVNDDVEYEEESQIPSELDTLKQRANMLGIKFHPNTGVDKLRAKIDAKLTANSEGLSNEQIDTALALKGDKERSYLTHDEFMAERTRQIRRDINKLIRIRITCMNPNKAEWEGEIFSVGSAKMGTFKKYVPFNAEDGWHVPKIIYDHIKERKYSQFYNAKGPRGEKIRKGKLMPEFSVEVLPPLTKEELAKLAQRQAMAKGSAAA